MNKVIIRLIYGERFEAEMSDEDFNEIINSLEDESVLFIRTHGLAVRRDQIVYVKKETTLSE